jgi:hypothetical protein
VTLFEIAEDLLDQAVAFLADPPARQFTTVGDVAVFPPCEQLAAAIQAPATSEGLGSASPSSPLVCMAVPLMTVCVELWRCVPMPTDVKTPPTAAALTASALAVSADIEDLFHGFLAAALDGSLLSEGCTLSGIQSENVGPSGGMFGFRLCVQFEHSRPTGAGS